MIFSIYYYKAGQPILNHCSLKKSNIRIYAKLVNFFGRFLFLLQHLTKVVKYKLTERQQSHAGTYHSGLPRPSFGIFSDHFLLFSHLFQNNL